MTHFPRMQPVEGNRLTGISRRTFLRTSGMLLGLQAAGVRVPRLWASPSPWLSSQCLVSHAAYPPSLEKLIAKLDPALDDFPSEVYVAEIEKVFAKWTAGLCRSADDSSAIRESLATDLSASCLDPSETKALRTSGPLRVERRVFRGRETQGREAFLAAWAAYLSPFDKLETVELEIYGVRITGGSTLRVETDVRCDLVGRNKKDGREQRVGSWIISWAGGGVLERRWTVTRWVVNEEVRSRLTGPGFTEITAACLAADSPGVAQLSAGIDDWRTSMDAAIGIDVYGNHGVAVGDIDGSGFDSFYVCQPSGLPNRLYRNRGDGTFEDITESSGTGILDGTASALFVDFLNRGRQDLLVVRTGGPLLLVNNGDGRFEAKLDAFHFARPAQGTFTSAAAADYNRDGLLDVYFCVYSYYQGLNQYQFPSPYYDAQNGPPNFLFRNRGDGTFEDVTAASGLDQNNNRFSFAVAWSDYDNNGWPDLYVANDFGRKNLYRNNGDGTFTDVAAKAGVEDYGPGMSACWLDYDNDGAQDLYVANMWLKEGKRITSVQNFLPQVDPAVRMLYQKHNAGNSLYRNDGKGDFEDRTREAGSAMGRWSWSCDSWDFDHDGRADLYVANGFVSGPKQLDLQSFFWRQVAQHSASPAGASPEYEMAWNAVNELVRSDYSWSGYQRNVFYANDGDGTFSDVSGVLGLDLRDDSRAFALSDFDHDGRLEFVLKNRSAPQLRILRNDLREIGNSVVLRLKGGKSNRDAIGTVVTIEAGDARQTKCISAGSGFASQHTKELFFGVGQVAGAISISVRWPTGVVERFDNIPINHRIEIEEGRKDFQTKAYKIAAPSGQSTGGLKDPPVASSVATWLVAPLFGPEIKLPDLQGETQQLGAMKGKPTLVNFFRADCVESRKQLDLWQKASKELSSGALSVVAVAVDSNADSAAVEALARSSGWQFPILLADHATVGAWNIQYRYLFDRRRDMPLPISFLFDTSGAVIKIYQGLAVPDTVANDWRSAPATTEERLARAMPFAGHYFGNPMRRDYFTYGIAYVQYGFPNEAQAAFQRVVDADPGYAAAWFNLGTIYLNKKDYAEARRCLLESVRLNPQDAESWNNLGMISGEQEKYDQALEEFQKAALANPNYMVAVENMVKIYQFQARPAEAQKALEELVAKAPQNAQLHLGLAMALVGQDQLARGREELETSVRLRPDNAEAVNNLGAVLLRMGKADEALAKFEEGQRLAPDFDRPFMNAAIVFSQRGNPAKASAVLEEFLSRHPESADARAMLDKMGTR